MQHADNNYRQINPDRLLAGLKRHAQVEAFDDRKALGGDDWDARIQAELAQADIFLALVTASFVGSEYINESELPIARQRRGEGKSLIVPVLFDHCYWKLLGIDEINFLPKDVDGKLKPISQWENQQSAALTQVVEHLHKQIEAITVARRAGATAVRTGIDLALYRQRAQAKWSAIDLAALARPGGADPDITIRLADVFVPPQARRSRPPMPLPRDWLRRQGLDPDKEAAQAEQIARTWEQRSPVSALDLIAQPAQRRLVLLGDPGAGKSALTRFVLLQLLAEKPPTASPLAALYGHVPLLIELRDFMLREAEGRCTDLLSYLGFVGESLGFGFSADAVTQHLTRAPALLIIDGLDEIFDPHRRRLMVDQIVGLATRFPQLRLLVTARIAGFDDQPFRSAEFAVATLVDLSQEQVATFAQHWFGLVFPGDPAAAERARNDLLQTVRRRPQLRVLAGNPMLLTIMATVARHKPLARSRAALYAQALELLCYNWDYRRGLNLPPDSPMRDLTPDDTPLMLRRVAWRMQESPDGLRANAMAESDLRGVLEDFFPDDWHFDAPKTTRAAREMEQRLQDRNWVVTLRGPGLYGFVHRTFLEYLCATEIAERFKVQAIDAGALIANFVLPRLDDDSWHEVLRLLVGTLPAAVAEQVIIAIVPDRAEMTEDATRLGLAWQALAEIEPRIIPSLAAACTRLHDALYIWLGEGRDTTWKPTAAIADAAESIGRIPWPVPHPPSVDWPGWSSMLPNSFPFIVVRLANTVWDCIKAVDELLRARAVDNPDESARGGALAALAEQFADEPRTGELLRARAVDDPGAYARGAALAALAEHFHAEPRTGELLRARAVDDPGAYARGAALAALAEHFRAEPRTGELLRARAVDDPDESARGAALAALAEHFRAEPRTGELLRARAVDDPGAYARGAALAALAEHFRTEARTGELLRARAVDDPGAHARGAALAALAEHFRAEPRTGELLRARAVDDPDESARGAALAALAEHFRDEPHTGELLRARAVDDPGADARRAALATLPERYEPRTGELLRARAVADPNAGARSVALAALAEHFRDEPRTGELLRTRAVDDPAENARCAALDALAQHFRAEPRTGELLRARAVDDPGAFARGAALAALAEHFRAEPRTGELLRARAVDDPDESARGGALAALAEHFPDEPRTGELLRARAVDDPDGYSRGAALAALAQHFRDEPRTGELLRARAVDDPDESARGAALAALAQHFRDEPRTGELLRTRAVDDPDENARSAALLGLSRTLGVEHAPVLCSRDLDGLAPGLDPRRPITQAMVAKASSQLGKPAIEVRDLYRQIARVAPLTLAWQTPKRKRV